MKLTLPRFLLVTEINPFPERMLLACTEGTTLTVDVCKKKSRTFLLNIVVQMKRDRLKSCFCWLDYLESQCRSRNNGFNTAFQCLIFNGIVCWWDWNVSRRFVFVLVIVSPFCRNIPWVEVDLATWATEKKTISHFLLSFMYCFGVNLDCDTHTDHFSQVAANVFITKDKDGVSSMAIHWLQKNEH